VKNDLPTVQPMVSIVLIFLNAERYIADAIDSVLAQTYSDWELLLVDDGSTDGSTQTALEYTHSFPNRIRYLHHPNRENRGMSAARNLGISCSTGRFIAFLDADDVWLPRKLEQQMELMLKHPEASVIYGLTEYWYSWTANSSDRDRDYVAELGVEPAMLIEPPVMLRLLLESKAPTPATSDVLIRRELLDRIGGFEDSFRGMFEDQVFFSKVYLHGSLLPTAAKWFRYRQHADSCYARSEAANEKHRAGLVFFQWLEQYLIQQGITDPAIWRALRKKRWRYRHPALQRLKVSIRQRLGPFKAMLKQAARHLLPAPVHRV